jgi:histidine triad (HIT) family protein
VEECIFCAIISERAPAVFLHRDDVVVAFMDIRPVNAGHMLVVPRQHEALVVDLDERVWAHMCEVGRRLNAALRASAGIRCEAVALYVADGAAAGQEVAHAHLHVIPRYTGDGFGFRFPPDYGTIASRSDLGNVAATIRATELASS